MKLRTLLFLSASMLTVTVTSIALVTVYFLSKTEDQTLAEQNAILLQKEALNSKFFTVQIQQFLTDASVTGDEDGIREAKENLNFLNGSLTKIRNVSPDLKEKTDVLKSDAIKFYEAGVEMVAAYNKSGKAAGNSIMQRPETGFDALAEKLGAELNVLEKIASEREEFAARATLDSHHQLLIQTILLSVLQFFVMIGSFIMIFRRTAPLERVVSNLDSNAVELESVTESVTSSASALSSAATQQASATQQTAAALEEIRAMVGKTADNSNYLLEKATETSHSVSTGKASLDAVIQTIKVIEDQQSRIAQTVEQTNGEIGQIVSLISEIGNKTKVINEIVFQTKLLSFNASVEAARAGEHGRGFAVVAEEVGGLAEMSGSASKEISSLLESSIDKVKRIVDDGRQRIAQLMLESRVKIEESVHIAHQCENSYEQIISQMKTVDHTTNETNSAIRQTVKGLDEIAKALSDLSQSTQSNLQTSDSTSQNSVVLTEQLNTLKASIDSVNRVISG